MLILKKGATGASVIALQQRLSAQGFLTGAVDGDFGNVTETAVRQFQAANNLKVDGVVGDKTWALLMSTPIAVSANGLSEQRQWLLGQIAVGAGPRQRSVLGAAISTLGWREQPDGSNGGPEVDRISTGYLSPDAPKPPWCALAVSYWLKEGLKAGDWSAIPFGKRFGAVSQIAAWGTARGSFTKSSASVLVEPATIFVMGRAGSGSDAAVSAAAGHTGLVVSDESTHVITIEGNTGNAVGSRRRRKTELSGFVTWW